MWTYGCGFTRWQNDTHVIFTSYLTYIGAAETSDPMVYLIQTPDKVTTVLEQRVSCAFQKYTTASTDGYIAACEKCLECLIGKTDLNIANLFREILIYEL